MTDMDGVAEIQVLDHGGCVGGVMVHVMAIGHLTRASMAAPIDPHHAITMVDEEQHLGIPVVGAQRPAVVEDNGLAMAPVFVEDLDSVLGGDGAHGLGSFLLRSKGGCYPGLPVWLRIGHSR